MLQSLTKAWGLGPDILFGPRIRIDRDKIIVAFRLNAVPGEINQPHRIRTARP